MISVTNNLDDSPVNTSRIRIPAHIGKYTIVKLIGKGGFAVVVQAVNDQTHQQVAIKICDRIQIQENNILAYLEAELRLSMRFNHPNIAKTYEVIYEPDIILIVMEYFPNGDLQSLLTNGVKFTTQEQIKVAIGVINGLNYLHQRGISHRDIKPENIVFDEKLNPKIIDFGLSKEDSSNLYTFCGTPYYVAPEMITNQSYNGMKADVWAFGVTLHCLATFLFPWDPISEAQYVKEAKEQTLKLKILPKGLVGDIISKCLTMNPKDRMTSAELLEYIESEQNSNSAISSANFKKAPNDPLPKLFARNNTPLHIKARRINAKAFGNLNLRYRNRLFNNNNL